MFTKKEKTNSIPYLLGAAMGLFAASIAVGCDDPSSFPGGEDIEVAEQEDALLGELEFGTDCTEDQREFLKDAAMYGRIAAISDAFEQCLRQRIPERYKKCKGDPYYDSTQAEQINRALAAARTRNEVHINCTGGGGNASTSLGTYGRTDDESLSFGDWLTSVVSKLDAPLCSSNGGVQPCRFAAYPWPYNQASSIVWHEVMHQHGYTHGANDQAGAKVACGYPDASDAEWHFQTNTMPYLLHSCISEVIDRSFNLCGNLETCGTGSLRIVNGWDSTTCSCIADPYYAPKTRVRGNSMLEMPNRRTAADLSGDGLSEWLVVSGSQLKVLRGTFDNDQELVHNFGVNINKIVTGRFEVSYKDNVCVLLTNGSFQCFSLNPNTHADLWWGLTQNNIIASDEHMISGDFDGDTKDELLVYKPSTGVFRMLEIASDGFMKAHPNFEIGNLSDTAKLKNKLVIAGNFADFGTEGVRDDILVFDTTTRELKRYDGRRSSTGKTTFWWAYTKYTPVAGEQLTVANVQGLTFDNIVLYNKNTGAYRFFNGSMTQVYPAIGQLPNTKNMSLYWVKNFPSPETGSDVRHDAIYWDPAAKLWKMYHARNSSNGYTYWWAWNKTN